MLLDRLVRSVFLVLCISPAVLQAQTIYTAGDATGESELTRNGQFVMDRILRDIGLMLAEEDKSKNDENSDDVPEPTPTPDGQEDDFFDDDFFDDDTGFDQAVEDLDQEFEETLADWDQEYEETIARWDAAKIEYNENKEQLPALTFDIAEFGVSATGQPAINAAPDIRSLEAMKPGDYHVIPYAFDIPIRDQVKRGTCAAFAGVRALEILLWQYQDMRDLQVNLSEQHFYWLSRGDCIESPCAVPEDQDGSWSDSGFERTQLENPLSALMLERDCPYVPYSDERNLSNTPLNDCNFNGQFRTGDYQSNLSLDEVMSELSNNRPVVAGFTLPAGFYDTNGLVKARDPVNAQADKDSHAQGHAIVLFGYIKLPEQFWSEEGTYCAITANSWADGYGVGGYACLTEQWMKENRIVKEGRSYFTSVTSVKFVN